MARKKAKRRKRRELECFLCTNQPYSQPPESLKKVIPKEAGPFFGERGKKKKKRKTFLILILHFPLCAGWLCAFCCNRVYGQLQQQQYARYTINTLLKLVSTMWPKSRCQTQAKNYILMELGTALQMATYHFLTIHFYLQSTCFGAAKCVEFRPGNERTLQLVFQACNFWSLQERFSVYILISVAFQTSFLNQRMTRQFFDIKEYNILKFLKTQLLRLYTLFSCQIATAFLTLAWQIQPLIH